MKIDNYMLILLCLVIFIVYIVRNPCNTETFINACAYHNQQYPVYGYANQLKPQIGTTGLELMHNNIDDIEKRASWIRNPEPRYQYQCEFDNSLNKKCKWNQIYTEFYPNLRGNQKNMISP